MKDSRQKDIDAFLAPVSKPRAQRRERRVRREFWSKFRRTAASLPFAEDLAAVWYCATDPATPLKVRGTLFAALAYFIMPADMVPDFIAVLGFTDDFAVLSTAIGLIRTHIRPEHREAARAAVAKERDVQSQTA